VDSRADAAWAETADSVELAAQEPSYVAVEEEAVAASQMTPDGPVEAG
jgi:hypothetical protein